MKFELKEAEGIIREVLDSGGEFRLYPKGTSMQPLIRAGRDSVVLVKSSVPCRINDLILFRRDDGDYVLHRVMRLRQDALVLCGDNQTVLEHGIRDDQVIGKVKVIHRGGKVLDDTSWSYKVYLKIWQNLTLRRILLGIYHRMHQIRPLK